MAMELKWDDSLSIGHEKLDSQHRTLVEKIAELSEIVSSTDIDMAKLRDAVHFFIHFF